MAVDHKLIKCEPSDPKRCQAKGDGGEGQCCFTAVEGSTTCPKHGGTANKLAAERRVVNQYRLQRWQQRVEEFSASEEVYNLRGEIGILRMQIEELLCMCNDSHELMIYSTRISDLVMKVEKVVVSCAKLENRQGNLLDKSQALILAGEIVNIISKEVKDAEAIDRISEGIITIVANLAGKDIEE